MVRNWFRRNGIRHTSPIHSVLVVSDDSSVLSLVGSSLKERKYLVRSTMSVDETLQLLEASLPDVLICDFARPEIEGKRLLEVARLRVGKSAMPTVVLLRDSHDDEILATNLGVDDLIVKPCDGGALGLHIDRLIAEKQPADL